MCGIAGMIGLPVSEDITNKLHNTMACRGPDDYGTYSAGECTLLHTRLAIIDPLHGCQPMLGQWGGESYCLVYNGELYNTEEIRRELVRLGHCFQTQTDTEVVLHAYMEWKERALDQLNGIFAFGIWEEKAKRLFLARDRMGVKPLFWMRHRGGLLFASEIKTILAYPSVRAEIDAQGAAEILLLGPGRTPGCGVFRGVEELEPGWFAVFESGRTVLSRYWFLRDGEHRDSFEETVEKVRYLVTDAIHRQMVSDVPIGTFLSGGLDSSIISAVCAREMAERGERLQTFSVDYTDNDKYFVPNKFQPNADGAFIRQMEEAISSQHHWTVLTPEDLVGVLEDATRARDLPGMADVDFSLLAFCGEIRKSVKVALSGECADEIFGGYPWFRDPAVRDVDGFPWSQNLDYRCSLMTPELSGKLDGREYVRQRYLQTIRESDIMPGTSPEERRMKEMANLNQRWFMATLLDRKDRMSMFHGLEVRVPFCDYRIAEYLYRIPWKYKDYSGMEKGLLRQAVTGLLPEPVRLRKKSPYPKTWHPKYRELVTRRLEGVLADRQAPIFQLVRREALEDLLRQEQEWPWYGQLMKTPQTIAYILQINFWLAEYNISVI